MSQSLQVDNRPIESPVEGDVSARSQRMRIVGLLDGIEASTRQFSLVLDSGEKLAGFYTDQDSETIRTLWKRRVVVQGTAWYCVSGRVLHIEADCVRAGDQEPGVFARLPSPPNVPLDVARLVRPQGPKSGMASIMGKWPGDESDDEVEAALARLS